MLRARCQQRHHDTPPTLKAVGERGLLLSVLVVSVLKEQHLVMVAVGLVRSESMSQTKKQRKLDNIGALRAMDSTGLVIYEFEGNCGRNVFTHLRIHGPHVAVDYWPSTSKAWVLESKCKGFRVTPAEVFEIARLTF